MANFMAAELNRDMGLGPDEGEQALTPPHEDALWTADSTCGSEGSDVTLSAYLTRPLSPREGAWSAGCLGAVSVEEFLPEPRSRWTSGILDRAFDKLDRLRHHLSITRGRIAGFQADGSCAHVDDAAPTGFADYVARRRILKDLATCILDQTGRMRKIMAWIMEFQLAMMVAEEESMIVPPVRRRTTSL